MQSAGARRGNLGTAPMARMTESIPHWLGRAVDKNGVNRPDQDGGDGRWCGGRRIWRGRYVRIAVSQYDRDDRAWNAGADHGSHGRRCDADRIHQRG